MVDGNIIGLTSFFVFIVEQDIVAATAACEEVRDSKKFAKVLELVLLVGNYLNSGTKNAQAVGFEMSYLPKVFFFFLLFLFPVHDLEIGRADIIH